MDESFSENLRFLCAEHGSISQICRDIGINRQQFNRYLNGSSMPSAHNLRRIARHFDLSEKQLFGDPAELESLLHNETQRAGENPTDAFLAPYRGQQKSLRRYLGFYHSHFCTPSWEGKIFVSLIRISEKDGFITCRSYENAISVDKSIRQISRYDGLVSMRGTRIFVTEHERTREGCVTQTILYSAHRQKLKYLRGITMGVAWRPYAHPYAAQTIWKRLDERVTAREAIERCGIYSAQSLQLDPTIRNYLNSSMSVLSPGKPT